MIRFFDSLGEKEFNSDVYIVKLYTPLVINSGTDGFIEATEKRCSEKNAAKAEADLKPYWILRAYLYLKDKENFLHYYRQKCQEIFQNLKTVILIDSGIHRFSQFLLDCGDMELFMEYLQHLLMVYKKISYSKILYKTKQITKYIPFQEIWDQEECRKSISESNYKEIYESIKDYLTRDELFEIFMEAIPYHYRNMHDTRLQLAFCQSGYAEWMQEVFPKELEKRKDMKDIKDWEEMKAAKEAYEKNWRLYYHYQINKAKKEIKQIMTKQRILSNQ